MVRKYLGGLSRLEILKLKRRVAPYLRFRTEVRGFQEEFLSETCTRKCFAARTSFCCGREGIATFFADVLINGLFSTEDEVDILLKALRQDRGGFKCVYLAERGCVWRIKPIVCEMFLCDHAKERALSNAPALLASWEDLRSRERQYTWPDRPVLFDELESLFLQAGFDSPLMYFHRSPGLLRVKARSRKGHSDAL